MLTSQRFDSDGMETFAACGTEWQQELRGVSSGSTRKPKYSEMCSYMGYKKSRNETQQQPRIIHLFSHDRLFVGARLETEVGKVFRLQRQFRNGFAD